MMTLRPLVLALAVCARADHAGASVLPGTAPTLHQQPAAGTQPPATLETQTENGTVIVTITVETLRIPAVNVELRNVDGNIVIGRTTSDAVGQVTFPDVPAGRYLVRAIREGFADAESAPFTVRAGATEQVLVEMRLTFVRESVDVVAPANSPTESLQPVAVSDVLTGAKMDVQPLAGDDFQSLLTVLPSVIRGPGRAGCASRAARRRPAPCRSAAPA